MPTYDTDAATRAEIRRRFDELRRDLADVRRETQQTRQAVERAARSSDFNWELVWMTWMLVNALFLMAMVATAVGD